jgi:hypothetical protein
LNRPCPVRCHGAASCWLAAKKPDTFFNQDGRIPGCVP